MPTHAEWAARVQQEHLDEVERGEHDDQCEFRSTSSLCHCSKRRREAAGYTEPPGELIWRDPECPRCGNGVESDPDGFTCEPCCVTWDRRGITAEFFDDYGDLLPVVDVHLPDTKES